MKKLYMARMLVLAVLFASGCALGMEEQFPVKSLDPATLREPGLEHEKLGATKVFEQQQQQQQLRDRLQVVIDRLDAVKNHLPSYIKVGVDLHIQRFKEWIAKKQNLTDESVAKEEEYATFAEKSVPYAFRAKLAAQRTGSAVVGGIKSGAEWVKGKAIGAARKTKEAVASGYKKSKAYKAKIAAGAAVTGAAAYFGPGIVRWTQEQIAKNPAVFEYFSKRNLAIAVGAAAAVYVGSKAVGRKRKGKSAHDQAPEAEKK